MLSSQVYGGAISTGSEYMDCRMERDQLVHNLSYSQMLRMPMYMDTQEEGGSNYECAARKSPMMMSMTSRHTAASQTPIFNPANGLRLAPISIDREGDFGTSADGDKYSNRNVGSPAGQVCTTAAIASTAYLQEVSSVVACSADPASAACRNSTRTCKLCGTSKTPLWRSGPMGAKSLCNACGIRSRKVKRTTMETLDGDSQLQQSKGSVTKRKRDDGRRLMSRSAAPVSRSIAAARTYNEDEQQDSDVKWMTMTKKKKAKRVSCAAPIVSPRTITEYDSFSCVTSGGSSTPSPIADHRKVSRCMCTSESQPKQYHRHHLLLHSFDASFLKDEEQAAFLLMALSCGLVLHS